MSAISSHTLFHMTSNYSTFKKILLNGLRFSYSLESVDKRTAIIQNYGYMEYTESLLSENDMNDNVSTGVAIPMICFCDIPLLRVGDHCKKYGNFAIGLDKEVMSSIFNNWINPVWYIESKNTSDFVKFYSEINYNTQKSNSDYISEAHSKIKIIPKIEKSEDMYKIKDEYFVKIKNHSNFTINTKIYSNYIYGYVKSRKIDNISYYDEREWRAILPDDEDIAPWFWDVSKEDFENNKKKWNGNFKIGGEYGYLYLSDEILNKAITHIIVDKNERIPDMIKYIMRSKEIFGVEHINEEQRLLLISKISSFERINQDY